METILDGDVDNVTIDGVHYEAVDSENCNNCAGVELELLCARLPFCSRSMRSDGRSIVWMEKIDDSLA